MTSSGMSVNRAASSSTSALTVGGLLAQRARTHDEKPFLWCGKDWISFAELDRRVDAIASGLAGLGLNKGDRVALILSNRVEIAETFFALGRIGVVAVPLNTYLKGTFLEYQLRHSGASHVVADRAGAAAALDLVAALGIKAVIEVDDHNPLLKNHIPYAELLAATEAPPAVDLVPGDLMSIMYTSGTTGYPKGCMMSHGYYTTMPTAILEGGLLTGEDRLATPFQFFHLSGQVSTMSCLTAGASMGLFPEFHARTFWAKAQELHATVLWGVGAMGLAMLAAHPTSPSAGSVRRAIWAPLKLDKIRQWEQRFGVPVSVEIYGQTECTPTTVGDLAHSTRNASSGRAPSYLDVAIVDDGDQPVEAGTIGEIVVRPLRPHALFSGYWRDAEASVSASRNYWHHTGDYGRFDSDGNLHFVDRKKDALRRRGENVSSIELEAAILEHPAVMQVAVHAVPSELTEDDIKACVVLSPGTEVSPAELFAFFSSTLPYFAIPRYVEVFGELPVNHLARINKRELVKRGVTADTWDFEALGLRVAVADRR
jgi:carnitine-CoA ligase